VGPDGTVYVADHGNNRVVAFTADGQFLRMWGRNGGDGTAGTGPGEFDQPRGVVTDAAGDVYVVEKRNNRVQEFTPDGQFLNAFGGLGKGSGQLNQPYTAAIDGAGNLYVTEVMNDRISQFGLDGSFRGMWGRNGGDGSEGSAPGEFHDPYGIAVDCRGGVYVSDEENDRIQRFGDPAAPFPRCAPSVTVTAVRGGGRGASLRAQCDRACTVYATAKAGVDGGKPVAFAAGGALAASRPDRITLRYPTGLRRAMAQHRARRLTVRVAAVGPGGTSPTVVKTVTL
jgi:DNA-binding beta-propeller fold protein YncE